MNASATNNLPPEIREWIAAVAEQTRHRGLPGIPRPRKPRLVPHEFLDTIEKAEALYHDVLALNLTYSSAIGEVLELFGRARTLKPGDADRAADPVLAIAETITSCEQRTAPRLDRIVARVEDADLARLPTSVSGSEATEAAHYIDALRGETRRFWKGIAYGQAWMVFAEHVLLALAAAFVLRQKAWKKQRGAVVASLVAACRSLGPLDRPRPGLPVREFGVAPDGESVQHSAGEVEVQQASERIVRLLLSPARSGDAQPAGRIQMIRSVAKVLGVEPEELVQGHAVAAALEGWGDTSILKLYQDALDGKLSVAINRISDRLLDEEVGPERRATGFSPARSEDGSDPLIKIYEARNGRPAVVNGEPTKKFKKFRERRTRYRGRRGGFDVVLNQRGSRAGTRKDGSGADTPPAEAQDLCDTEAFISEPEVAGTFISETSPSADKRAELSEVLAQNPPLRDLVDAAREHESSKDIAAALKITPEGVKKRKRRLKDLLL